jgi:hypothetical protein
MQLKNFSQFLNENEEMSDKELESQKTPNYVCVKDFVVPGEDEALCYKDDLVYYDVPGERLVVIEGGNPGMIVDLDAQEMKDHFLEISSKEGKRYLHDNRGKFASRKFGF